MPITTGSGIAIIVCAVAALALVVAERRAWLIGKALAKISASTAFVVIAIQRDAAATAYGRLILAALALSWVGDVLLLSRRSRLFLLGIASFLLAHIVFSLAFAQRPWDAPALAAAFAALGCGGMAVLVWLWRHLSGFYRVAVSAYVAAIVAMASFGIALSAASGNWLVAGAALTFAASDISVARDRFIAAGFINRAWGLPLYYAAQVVLALSVGIA